MEYECWDDAERMEHEELDTWLKEQPGLVDITMMEDEYVPVMDMDSEHDFLDAVMERLSLIEDAVGWEEPLDDKLLTGRSRKIEIEDDMEMDPKMIMYNQEEIQEDAYVLGGM